MRSTPLLINPSSRSTVCHSTASRIAKCYSFARGTFKCPCVLGVLPEGARKGREMGNASWLDAERKKMQIALKCMEEYRSQEVQDSFLRIAIEAGMRVARGE